MLENTPISPPGAHQGRLSFLDSARGVAVLLVMCYHFIGMSQSPLLVTFRFIDLGKFGISIFFVCSGFIIPVSLNAKGSLTQFWIRRFFRLYPLYWFSIGLWLIGVYSLHWGQFTGEVMQTQPILGVLANLTMLQPIFGVEPLVLVYWTLSLEMAFYIMVSVLFALGILHRTVPIAVITLGLALLLEGLFPLITGIKMPSILIYLGSMWVGAVLYRVMIGEVRPQVAARVILLALLMDAVAAIGPALVGHIPPATVLPFLAARFGAYGIFVVMLKRREQMPGRLLLYIGQISYSLYLMHLIVVTPLARPAPLALLFAVGMGGSLLLATLTYYAIELPSIGLGRRFSAQRPQPTGHEQRL